MEVNTGGVKTFDYSQAKTAKMSAEGKEGIREAYARAGERKRKEQLRRVVLGVIIALVVLGAVFFLRG